MTAIRGSTVDGSAALGAGGARQSVDLRRLADVWYRRRWPVIGLVMLTMLGIEFANWVVYPTFQSRVQLLIEAPAGLDVPFSRDKLVFKKSEITQTQSELVLSRPNLESVIHALDLEGRPRFTDDLRGKVHRLAADVLDFFRNAVQSAKEFVIVRVFGGKYTPSRKPTRFDEVLADLERPAVLSVEPVTNTDVIEIVARDRDPEIAAAIANRLAEVYLASEIAMRKQRARDAYEAIEQRLSVLRPELEAARAAVAQFKDTNRIANLDGQIDATLKTLSMLELSYWDVCQKESVRSLSAWEAVQHLSTSERDVDMRAKASLLDRSSELAQLETIYQPDHPKVVAARAAVEELRKQISAGLSQIGAEPNATPNVDTDSLKQSLLTKVQELQQELSRLSHLNTQYQALTWDQEHSGDVLNFLVRKREDALTAEWTTQAQARVVAPAEPEYQPGWPAKWRNRGLALMTALVVAVSVCALLEYLDSSLRRPEDVDRLLGLRTLGSIPHVRR